MKNVGEQMTLFDQDTWFGKTCQVHCPQTKAMTSVVSSKKRQGLSKKMPQFLDLTRGGGITQEASWEMGIPSLGNYTMHNIGECHNVGNASAYLQTSMGTRQQTFSSHLNTGEHPREARPTKLSEILEAEADTKYNLSARACQGILNRANKRGKALPRELQEALENQIASNEE